MLPVGPTGCRRVRLFVRLDTDAYSTSDQDGVWRDQSWFVEWFGGELTVQALVNTKASDPDAEHAAEIRE